MKLMDRRDERAFRNFPRKLKAGNKNCGRIEMVSQTWFKQGKSVDLRFPSEYPYPQLSEQSINTRLTEYKGDSKYINVENPRSTSCVQNGRNDRVVSEPLFTSLPDKRDKERHAEPKSVCISVAVAPFYITHTSQETKRLALCS